MVFSTCAFYESQDASAALTEVAAVADTHLTVSGDDITIPPLNLVIGAFAMGSGLVAAQLSSPSLRSMALYDFASFLPLANLPSDQDVDEGGSATYIIPLGAGIVDMTRSPLELVPSEKLNFKVKNGGSAGAWGVVFLADAIPTPVSGKIFTVKATSSTTCTANKWTSGTLTFSQDLPAGRYQVVGMRAKSANIVAARLMFVGQVWRAGCIGVRSYDAEYDRMFRYGNLGVFGEFEFDQPPQIEFLATSGDTSEEVWLDLIQIRAGR